MALSDITIHRDYQIINQYVQVPNNLAVDRTRITEDEGLATYAGSDVIIISPNQRILRLAGESAAIAIPTE